MSRALSGGADPADGDAAASAPEGLTRADREVAGRLGRFAARSGGAGAVAVVEYLGRSGARIVVVAADGSYGDAVVSGVTAAHAVCAAAGLLVVQWDRALSARISPTPADRRRMAGTGR